MLHKTPAYQHPGFSAQKLRLIHFGNKCSLLSRMLSARPSGQETLLANHPHAELEFGWRVSL